MISERTASDLWQDYLFLTTELVKFSTRNDLTMFEQLLDQREKMQPLLVAVRRDNYLHTAAGRAVLAEIVTLNKSLTSTLKLLQNKVARQLNVSQSYDGSGDGCGSRVDFQG